MTPPGPVRLHVLLAREAPVGLVIRHGPRDRACTILWDRTTDTFQLGQWLKGRIYSRRSDISPDGKYWVYFALKGTAGSSVARTWTVLAPVPYLKALEFYPECGTWGGGGRFSRDGRQWVHGQHLHPTPVNLGEAIQASTTTAYQQRDDSVNCCNPNVHPGEDPLARDGWALLPESPVRLETSGLVYQRPVGAGWVLRKFDLWATSYRRSDGSRVGHWQEHQLLHPSTGETIDLPAWEWADLDRERVVWVEKGKLFAGRMSEAGLEDERMLYDFNAMTFEAIPAPY